MVISIQKVTGKHYTRGVGACSHPQTGRTTNVQESPQPPSVDSPHFFYCRFSMDIFLYAFSVMYSPGPVNFMCLNAGLTGQFRSPPR